MPTPLAHHVILRLASNGVLAPSRAEQRAAARAVLETGREAELFAFFLPDGHLHAGVGADRAAAGRFAQRLVLALRAALPNADEFDPARIVPVEDHAHLRRLVPYIFGQAAHHGVDGCPALEASNVPDLLGMRTFGSWTIPNLRARLPRLRGEQLRAWLGLPDLAPRCVAEHLVDAAAAAACLPDLGGRSPEVVAARTAAIHAAAGVLPDVEVEASLGINRNTRWRLARAGAPAAAAHAVLLQCDARARLAAQLDPARPYEGGAASPPAG